MTTTQTNALQAELEALRAENEQLKQATTKELRLKVSQKGALSLYGLGRFPVTLYKEQWVKVLGFTKEIKGFIADNDSELKTK